MSATGLGSAAKMREFFFRRDNKGENGENTHTKKKGSEESTARNSTDHFGG